MAEFLGDMATSIPTFSKSGMFKTFETLEITRFTPNCLVNYVHHCW